MLVYEAGQSKDFWATQGYTKTWKVFRSEYKISSSKYFEMDENGINCHQDKYILETEPLNIDT